MPRDEKFYLGNKNLPVPTTQFEWTPEMLAEIEICKKNLLHFAENHFYIINVDEGRQKIKLYKYQKRILRSLRDNRFVICTASRQIGKALALETPIKTPNGWTTMGEIKDGDQVYDETGKICNVVKAHKIHEKRNCYKVIFDNDEEIIADEEHLWFTQTHNERKRNTIGSTKTTKQILDTLYRTTITREPNHRIPIIQALEGQKQNLEISPYLLGAWLGDGKGDGVNITVGKQDVEQMVLNIKKSIGTKFDIAVHERKRKSFDINVIGLNRSHNFKSLLRNNNLLQNKHIPQKYLNALINDRLELLRGLMDTDGYIDKKGCCHFYTTLPELAKQVNELLVGLGNKVYQKEFIPKYRNKNAICAKCYDLCFYPNDIVFCLPRKISRQRKIIGRSQFHYIKNIIPVNSIPVRCITVDSPSHQYLCGKQMIPTHNSTLLTVFALWLACFFDDQHILILANKEDTAIELLNRVRLAYEMIPNYLKPGVKNFSKTLVELANGSQIKASTTSADSGRGQSISCLIVDEMAYVEDLDRFFQSVYPTISSSKKAKIFAVSTPNGKNNLFYKLFDGALKKDTEDWNGWHPEKVNWYEVPGRDEKWKQITLKTIGSEKAFKIEFENYFEDQSGETQFGKEVIDLLKTKTTTPLEVFDDGKGVFKIWEVPANGNVYSIGVDVGEGVGKNASTIDIIDITDITNIKQVANYTTNKTEPSFFAIKVLQLAEKWGNPPVLVERNNHGGIVIDVLWNIYHYKNLVTYIPNAGEASIKYYDRKGVMSHTNSKYTAITNMRYYIGEKRYVQINDIDTIKEYETFKKRSNGSWGCDDEHTDDKIISLMWALFILDPKINKDFFEIVEKDPQGKPMKMIPNFDTYIKADMMFPPKRFSRVHEKENKDLLKYRFLPTHISSNVQDDINDLSLQGWKPLNTTI